MGSVTSTQCSGPYVFYDALGKRVLATQTAVKWAQHGNRATDGLGVVWVTWTRTHSVWKTNRVGFTEPSRPATGLLDIPYAVSMAFGFGPHCSNSARIPYLWF